MMISEITDTDIVAVSDVLVSAYKDEPWNENWTRERAILGFVDPYSDEDFFYVSELFVKSERRGQGIGTALDKHLKANNIQAMQLISIQNNFKFYKQNGLKKDMVDVLYKRIDSDT